MNNKHILLVIYISYTVLANNAWLFWLYDKYFDDNQQREDGSWKF